jgi:hypothetical protein
LPASDSAWPSARPSCEAHGGSISAMNRAGQGAAFAFTLPVSQEAADPGGRSRRSRLVGRRRWSPIGR